MQPGKYKTEHGSEVLVHTINAGSWTANFDRLEEPHACFDCHSIDVDPHEHALTWECEYCGGGIAKLKRI